MKLMRKIDVSDKTALAPNKRHVFQTRDRFADDTHLNVVSSGDAPGVRPLRIDGA
jgi:hypothetical protein